MNGKSLQTNLVSFSLASFIILSFCQLGFGQTVLYPNKTSNSTDTAGTPPNDTAGEARVYVGGIATGALAYLGVKHTKKYFDERKDRRAESDKQETRTLNEDISTGRLQVPETEYGCPEVNKRIEVYEKLFSMLPDGMFSVGGLNNPTLKRLSPILSKWYLHSGGIVTMPKASHELFKKLQKQLGDFDQENLHEESESLSNLDKDKTRKEIERYLTEFINSLRKDLCLD